MARSAVGLEGRFRLWHRHPEYGLLWEADLANGVTTQGATHLLERAFRGGAGVPQWKVGFVSAAGYTGVADTDTYAAHAGWAEYTGAGTGSGSKRGGWTPDAAQGGRIDSAGVLQVGVTASGGVRGVFLCDRVQVGDTDPSGTLYSTAVAGADLSVTAGGVLYVTYSLRARPVS